MTKLKSVLKHISFTRNETKVILFIIAVLVAGFSIKYYKQVISAGTGSLYDFSKSDSEFRIKSGNAYKNNFSGSGLDSSKDSDAGQYGDREYGKDSINSLFTGLISKSININTATKEELVELPGIGESIAEKIISYRDSKKGFKKIDEIMSVKGIGKKKFEKIKEYIKTE